MYSLITAIELKILNLLNYDLNINSIYYNEQLNEQSVYSYSYLLLVLVSNILYYKN